jgi:hypothetical protein
MRIIAPLFLMRIAAAASAADFPEWQEADKTADEVLNLLPKK